MPLVPLMQFLPPTVGPRCLRPMPLKCQLRALLPAPGRGAAIRALLVIARTSVPPLVCINNTFVTTTAGTKGTSTCRGGTTPRRNDCDLTFAMRYFSCFAMPMFDRDWDSNRSEPEARASSFAISNAKFCAMRILDTYGETGQSGFMFATKRKFLQVPAIRADDVYWMQQLLPTNSDSKLKAIFGFLPFCVYNYARFGDAVRGDLGASDLQESISSDLALIEIELGQYKTATGDRNAIFLPWIAFGFETDSNSWVMAWEEACKQSGADAMTFMMCEADRNSCFWLSRMMTSAQGSFWVEYDSLVGASIELRMIEEAIEGDLFYPDLPLAGRICDATGMVVNPKTVAGKSQEKEDKEKLSCREKFSSETLLLQSNVEDCTSGTLQVVADVHKLFRDRNVSINMLSIEVEFGAPGQGEFCEQYRAVIGV